MKLDEEKIKAIQKRVWNATLLNWESDSIAVNSVIQQFTIEGRILRIIHSYHVRNPFSMISWIYQLQHNFPRFLNSAGIFITAEVVAEGTRDLATLIVIACHLKSHQDSIIFHWLQFNSDFNKWNLLMFRRLK